jgi:hypothetical protein
MNFQGREDQQKKMALNPIPLSLELFLSQITSMGMGRAETQQIMIYSPSAGFSSIHH